MVPAASPRRSTPATGAASRAVASVACWMRAPCSRRAGPVAAASCRATKCDSPARRACAPSTNTAAPACALSGACVQIQPSAVASTVAVPASPACGAPTTVTASSDGPRSTGAAPLWAARPRASNCSADAGTSAGSRRSTRTPAATAAARSAASKAPRASSKPGGSPSRQTNSGAPQAAPCRIGSRRAAATTTSAMPMRCSMRSAEATMVSNGPENADRPGSTNVTARPRRAHNSAAAAPATPPPRTRTSHCVDTSASLGPLLPAVACPTQCRAFCLASPPRVRRWKISVGAACRLRRPQSAPCERTRRPAARGRAPARGRRGLPDGTNVTPSARARRPAGRRRDR